MMNMRVGFGFDVHQLKAGEPFWIGGIQIEHDKGAVGHSDADVLLHAISDALLGAAALGDIGTHFPDTDPQYKGIDSKILLQRVMELITQKGFLIGNVDATLALQAPKVKPYIPRIQEAISNILHLPLDTISIKATTTEKLGYVGAEEGVNAYAVVLLYKK